MNSSLAFHRECFDKCTTHLHQNSDVMRTSLSGVVADLVCVISNLSSEGHHGNIPGQDQACFFPPTITYVTKH